MSGKEAGGNRRWGCPDCEYTENRHHAAKKRPFCNECESRHAVLVEMVAQGPGKEKFVEHGGEK